jgi:hypothetical protein
VGRGWLVPHQRVGVVHLEVEEVLFWHPAMAERWCALAQLHAVVVKVDLTVHLAYARQLFDRVPTRSTLSGTAPCSAATRGGADTGPGAGDVVVKVDDDLLNSSFLASANDGPAVAADMPWGKVVTLGTRKAFSSPASSPSPDLAACTVPAMDRWNHTLSPSPPILRRRPWLEIVAAVAGD